MRNSRSAVFRSPVWKNAQPRVNVAATGVFANAAGTGGGTNSGNFGTVTTGAGIVLGAHALTSSRSARAHFLILEILHPASVAALRDLGRYVERARDSHGASFT